MSAEKKIFFSFLFLQNILFECIIMSNTGTHSSGTAMNSGMASPRIGPSYPIQSSLDEETIQQVQATLAMNMTSYEQQIMVGDDASPNHELAF